MRLLVIAQKIDMNDPVLGFFHGWIAEFAQRFKSIVVICLFKGSFNLPDNVAVLSLGKEKWKSKFKYIFLLFYFSLRYFNRYDAVFVHMNEEYPVLAGWLWRLMGKKVYMWRNHHAGNRMTDIAAFFCNKIFCTSKYSYTARYKKTVLMPLGIDTSLFAADASVKRIPQSILSLGRIAPSKHFEVLIDVLGMLKKRGVSFSADIYGDALPKDAHYLEMLKGLVKKNGLETAVTFHQGIPNTDTPRVYAAHDIFVNMSSSGMYDKTIGESMACGCLVLASNDNLRGQISDDFIFAQGNREECATKLEKLLRSSSEERHSATRDLSAFAETQSLSRLTDVLFKEISSHA